MSDRVLREGQWNLLYDGNGVHPGVDFLFGTRETGFDLVAPYEITYGDPEVGDVALPREDGVRLGQDYRSTASIAFSIGVDTVDDAPNVVGRHGANLGAVSLLGRAWRADAVRRRFGERAVLRTRQGGRVRRFYGRPRKFAPAASRLTRLGHTIVEATFLAAEDVAYDDRQQTTRVDMAPAPHRGLVGPLRTPLSMTGPGATKVPGEIVVAGDVPTWPVLTIYGPIATPQCEVLGQWMVTLNLNLDRGQWVRIDPRPLVRTVMRNGNSSVADTLDRHSPLLADMRLPLGRHDLILRGRDDTGTSYMTVSWRDAYAYL
ncbi:hypothetical protein ACQEVS_09775 [Streptomyces sp. CA-181903]|uniref:hypothetical protein n=1 Tax=Streptomyces sp. CA-181903 TaxID=3240055 RepID=UPI003D90A9F0